MPAGHAALLTTGKARLGASCGQGHSEEGRRTGGICVRHPPFPPYSGSCCQVRGAKQGRGGPRSRGHRELIGASIYKSPSKSPPPRSPMLEAHQVTECHKQPMLAQRRSPTVPAKSKVLSWPLFARHPLAGVGSRKARKQREVWKVLSRSEGWGAQMANDTGSSDGTRQSCT